MGYSTDFDGFFTVEPPLNESEISYLRDFAQTRRMNRANGPYFVKGDGYAGQDLGPDKIVDHNTPPPGQPGLWCQWTPAEDGTYIEWDGGEKFYEADKWIKYLIVEFLMPRKGRSLTRMLEADVRFKDFTFDHVVNGTVEAQGEEGDDRWDLVVEDNVVKVVRYSFTPSGEYTV